MIRGTGDVRLSRRTTPPNALSSSALVAGQISGSLLDLWAEKDFKLGGQPAHVRLGNQVINWGESYFATGGINRDEFSRYSIAAHSRNALKQALLPAPMLSFAAGLGHGFDARKHITSSSGTAIDILRSAPIGRSGTTSGAELAREPSTRGTRMPGASMPAQSRARTAEIPQRIAGINSRARERSICGPPL